MNEKKVTIITVVCLILIVLAGGGAIYYFQFEVLAEKERELEAVRARVKDAKDKVAKIPGLIKKIEEIQKALEVEGKRIPDLSREEYDKLADLLDGFRQRSGVTVDRAGWGTPKAPIPIAGRPNRLTAIPRNVHKVEYDLTVTGTFYQLLRYINLLEQEQRFLNVESFSVVPGAQAPVRPTAAGVVAPQAPLRRDLKVTVYTYTYRPVPKPFELEASVEPPSLSTDVPD
jgi:Tfp pilus assembly protein PilO